MKTFFLIWGIGFFLILSYAQKAQIKEHTIALKSLSANERLHAIKSLGEMGAVAQSATSAIVNAIKDKNDAVATEALNTIKMMGLETKKEIIIYKKTLKNKKPFLKVQTLQILGKMGSEAQSASAEIVKLLNDKNTFVRKEALKTLGLLDLESSSLVKHYKKALKSKYPDVIITAITETGKLKAEATLLVPLLIKALTHKHKVVRGKAAHALGNIGKDAKEALLALETAFKDDVDDVRYEASWAWSRISGKKTPPVEMKGDLFQGRLEGEKKKLLKAGGGDKKTESAVLAGLIWLEKHQNPEGFWSADKFVEQCKGKACAGAGKDWSDTGQTGLALLAFLGAGNTSDEGRFKEQIQKGVGWLIKNQTKGPAKNKFKGLLGPQWEGMHYMYNHTIATLALVEAYSMGGKDKKLEKAAQIAVDFLIRAQHPKKGGWRYEPGETPDSSVTGWAVMALKSATSAGLSVPPEVFEGPITWYNSVTDKKYFRSGYLNEGDPGARMEGLEDKFVPVESMTAASIIARVFCGENPETSPAIRGGAILLLQTPPKWIIGKGKKMSEIDFYYWYYGSLAMFQVGGKQWDTWNSQVKDILVKHQNTKGCKTGSWDPIGAWGREAGRVYSTSINVLTLETYYRYPKME